MIWSPIHCHHPDTSQSCKTVDMGPMCCIVCLYTSQLSLLGNQFMLLGNRGTWV